MQKKPVFSTLAILLLLGAGIWFFFWQQAPGDRPHFKHAELSITRADGTVFPFKVEVATTPPEQEYGLMFVHNLAADHGMIFPYDPPRPVAFWMKNTLIPLDMLFIGANHKIIGIVANARPEDVTPIASPDLVSAVIEIPGGQAKQDGLAVGDKIITTP